MSNLFHIIDGAQVILRSGGVFHQKKVFYRGERLYAQWGAGFVRLDANDGTSAPKVSWEDLDIPADVVVEAAKAQRGPVFIGVRAK